MANDDDDLNLDDGGSSAPVKKGKLGGIFPSLLKWIIIGLASVIVIVVIVFFTVKIVNKNKLLAFLLKNIRASVKFTTGINQLV